MACVVGVVVVAAALDFFLRTPSGFRMGLWIAGVLVTALAAWKLIGPALRFRPSITEVALRIEQSPAGRAAGLSGVLAAGVELAGDPRVEPVVQEAAQRFRGLSTAAVLRRDGLVRNLAALLGVVVVAGSLWGMMPTLSAIGAKRILAPWAGAQWPKRTAVADATDRSPHARGSGLLLRAVVSKNITSLGADDTGAAHVWAKYRIVVNGVADKAVRRVLLTSQNRTEHATTVDGQATEGALFEYLVEPWGLTPTGASHGSESKDLATADAHLEYWFETEDDTTDPSRVLLVEPPSVVSATATMTAPAYVSGPDFVAAGTKTAELGAGTDERAAPAAVLAGSRVRIVIKLNKPVPTPLGESATDADRAERLRATFGDVGASALASTDASLTFEDTQWTLEWTLKESARLAVKLEDQYHITGPDCSFAFTVIEDKAPSATVTVPSEDRTVLPTAVVDLTGEGRDDLGLAWASIEHRVAHRPKGSEGATPEPTEPAVELAKVEGTRSAQDQGALPKQLVVSSKFDLGPLHLQSGDEVWITAKAADAFALGSTTHAPTLSPARKLRIISAEELVEQVWSELTSVRRDAIATEEEQSKINRDLQRNGEASRLDRSQASLTDRIARDREALQRIRDRVKENDLKEETLEQVLRDAGQLLDQAGKASVDASKKLQQAANNEQQQGGQDAKSRSEASSKQDQVRDDLSKLIDLLDQGQDTWASKRAIEKLLQEQKNLREQTAQAGKETMGKQPEQLTPEQREELAKIANQQRDLAQKTAETVKQMNDAEPKLRKNDPAAADAMSQAARQAQQQQVQQKMDQASQQVQQNQTNRAQEQQDQAEQALQDMLQTLKNTSKNRDEVLRRKLASLIESLETLIKDQQAQLEALAAGIAKTEFAGLDTAMARLHQNTLGVLDEAAQGPREIAPVADIIQEAANAQSASVIALRANPVNAPEAQTQEQTSLEKLKEAKALAEKLDRDAADRQTRRKRDELKRAYRDALAEQIAIRAETDGLAAVEQTRRTRATARTLGEREAALQDSLAKLERDTKELADAIMFSFAHKRLDDATGSASKRLADGVADKEALKHEDRAVRVLQQLVQALEDADKKDDDFRQQSQQQQQNGQQNSNGQTPLVPPMAEVKLLKSMQQEIADLTKEAADHPAESAEAQAVGGLQNDLAKQGEALIKKLTERRRPGAPKPTDKPGDKPSDQPGDKPAEKPDPGTPANDPAGGAG